MFILSMTFWPITLFSFLTFTKLSINIHETNISIKKLNGTVGPTEQL